MKTFEFEKQGIKFVFRNPKLNKCGKLVMEYKIPGIKENKDNSEGYFYNSEFLPDKNAMTFYNVKIKGKTFGCVELPEDILKEIKTLFEELKTERERNINQVVTELVEGKRNIHFSIVGCDYPHYQAWIRNLPEDLQGLEQNIMGRAIKKIMGENEFVSNPCDYIQRIVKKSIGTIEDLGEVLNHEYNSEVQKYHGFKETIVTGFEMNLKSILQPFIEKKVDKQKEKQSMKVEILKQGYTQGEEKDPYAIVKITDIQTGESAQFVCRNIFDVGYVINPNFSIIEGLEPGGLLHDGKWETFEAGKGWYPVREATEFEKKAVEYLHKFPPIFSGIRL